MTGELHKQAQGIIPLFKKTLDELTRLLNKHVQLIKVEIKDEILSLCKSVVFVCLGLCLGFTGLIFFGFFLIFFLSIFMPIWLSAFLVTFVYWFASLIFLLIIKNTLKDMISSFNSVSEEGKTTAEEASKWILKLK